MFFRSKRSRRESGEGATTLQFHLKRTSNSPCGRRAPPADLLESCHLMAKKNSGVTRQQRGFNHRPERPDVMVNCDAGRCESKREKGCSGSLLQLRAPSLQTHNPPITLLRYTYRRASPPSLLSQNTQKRGENQSPHKKSRWEYIIWSEKQFVLAIYCLCAKVISLSSSISAGSSDGVGGGHYTTWLQNLHRPLQRPGSLSERSPR